MTDLLKTPLTDWHVARGAKMAEFAGYSMPINYPTGALKEIRAVRENAGLFDISHMRPITVEGQRARAFLNFVDTRNLSSLRPGDAKYGILCNEKGEPIDDIIVYMSPYSERGKEIFLVIANASNGTRVYEHLLSVKKEYKLLNKDVTLSDGLDEFGFISLQGPKAEAILSEAVYDAKHIPKKYYSCSYALLFGYFALITKTGYTGESGFEILCPKEYAIEIWTQILEVGTSYGLIPCGLAARDTLRLEAGMPLFGHEMDKDHDPITAGLGRYVDFNGRYFIGKTALEVRDGSSPKPREYFHAFIMEKGRSPRHGTEVYFSAEASARTGKITSAGPSPTLNKNIAMGYLDRQLSLDTEVWMEIGGSFYPAKVTKLPFYKSVNK